jgi:hypothetical protein
MAGPDVLDGKGNSGMVVGTPFPITPADGSDLAYVTRAITIGSGGDVKCDVKNPDNSITTGVVLPSVPAGSYPWRLTRIYSTGTTASQFTGTR